MTDTDLKALIAPLTEEERKRLRDLLDGVANDSQSVTNPLRGSVGRYDDPFEPAVPPEDWEVLR